jgi:DNA polymerase-3 subunit gamma/tau
MAKALYRKYRPCKLEDVVGQEQVTKALENSLKQDRVFHAYLFIGPRGTGKTSVARIFAHEINNFKYEVEDDYVDIIEIDGASNRGIDNIRELREKVAIAPTIGKYKVYIIDEVHMLTKEAFNALLKTLEEPPKHAVFIMATTDAHKVPVTITSRAQTYVFRLAEEDVMLKYLDSVAKKEKIDIEEEALRLIVQKGGGSFRDSLSLLDQISTLSDDRITEGLVIKSLGLAEEEKIKSLLSAYQKGSLGEITDNLREILTYGVKPETIAEEMINFILKCPKTESIPLISKLVDVKSPFAEAKLLVALAENAGNANEMKIRKEAPSPERAPVKEPKEQVKNNSDFKRPVVHVDFNWESFIETVKKLNDAISSQLTKCKYSIENNILNLYPDKKITRTILARDNNKKILLEASNGIKIVIREVGEYQEEKQEKDKLLSEISDIMGGEVQNDGGESPF